VGPSGELGVPNSGSLPSALDYSGPYSGGIPSVVTNEGDMVLIPGMYGQDTWRPESVRTMSPLSMGSTRYPLGAAHPPWGAGAGTGQGTEGGAQGGLVAVRGPPRGQG